MSDQQNEWWRHPGATPPAPPAPSTPPTRATFAPGAIPQPSADPDATVIVPARHEGSPPASPGYGGTPAQNAPQQAPPGFHQPGAQPPNYGGPPPGSYPPQVSPGYGGPQFVDPSHPSGTYRAPGGAVTMIVGALVAMVGTLLPWVTFGNESVNGYEAYIIGDDFDGFEWTNPGAFVVGAMILVIISAVIVLTAGRRVATWIIALLAAGFGGLMALGAIGAVGSILDNAFARDAFGIGVGVVLCLLGAIVSGVGAIIVAAKRS